ncbi:nucleotidyl transferase AbiEii/AbiGii toxin family protein [archaeon]|nr:nucleotidyl transferase AbiEii/AbiGii toxin family protein [archaeon]
MDKIISIDELKVIAGEKGFDIETTIKDYYLTYILFLIKDIKGLYFKGGTALYKIFLNHLRLSEDLDFTATESIRKIEKQIKERLKSKKVFKEITHDKRVKDFTRLIVHYVSYYGKDSIIIDLNKRAKIYLKSEEHNLIHFYKGNIPEFKVKTLNVRELIAEKICAMVQRYAPRDYYDVYEIIKNKLPIDIKLVKKKFVDSDEKYDIGRIFRRGNKIYNKWESDLLPLTTTKPEFKKVMNTLMKYFKYKEK